MGKLRRLIQYAKLVADSDAKTILYDGRTGELLDNRVSVGVMHMIKPTTW